MSTIYREGDDFYAVQAFRQLAFGKPVKVPPEPRWQRQAYDTLVLNGLAEALDNGAYIISEHGRQIADAEAAARKDTKALVPVLPKQRKKKPRRPHRLFPEGGAWMRTADYVRRFCELNNLKM